MYTRDLLLVAVQAWLAQAAGPPNDGVRGDGSQLLAPSRPSILPNVPNQPIIMPPMMDLCRQTANLWQGFTIQQRDILALKSIPNLETRDEQTSLAKRRFRGVQERPLCYKIAEFDFFSFNASKGNTQTVTLRKNTKYTMIVYSSANVWKISTWTPEATGWKEFRSTKFNDTLVSYSTWVGFDQEVHFTIHFDPQALPVHGKMILYQLPIPPSGPQG